MARLDGWELNACKLIKEQTSREGRKALEMYHALSNVHSGLETSDDRLNLILSTPHIAAQVFYHFNDTQTGQMLVRQYRSSADASMRELALGVKQVLQYREEAARDIARIAGMQVVPSVRPDRSYDNWLLDGLEGNRERVLEYA